MKHSVLCEIAKSCLFGAILSIGFPAASFAQAEAASAPAAAESPAPVKESATQPADAPAKSIDLSQFTSRIANARTMVTNLKAELERTVGEIQGVEGQEFYTEDLEATKKHYEEIIANYEKAVETWSSGDGPAGEASFEKAQAGLAARDVWRRRLSEFRRAQANAAPSEKWTAEMSANVRPGATPAFDKLIEAKKAAADAWGAVAEATVPDADPDHINELKESAFTATSEAEIALWQYSWANQLEGSWSDVTAVDVEPAVAALRAAQDQLVALRRENAQHDRRVREANVTAGKAQEELYRSIGAAREAKARAAAEAAAAGGAIK